MRGDGAPPDFIHVNGVRIRYCLEGVPGAPVILFSNSLATNLDMWAGQAAALASRYRVLRYDTRGHGESEPGQPPYSLDLLAGDVLALLDALSLKRVVFVGLSLGGMIAQLATARWPERFVAVVLCDTAMRMNRAVWEERIAAVRADGIEPQVEPSLGRWFTPAFRAGNPQLMEQVRAIIRTTSRDGLIGCAAAIRDMELEEVAPKIALPALVLVGAEDASTPPAQAEALRAAIPGAELVVIPSAAHLPNLEQPKIFNDLLGEFLARHAAT